MLYRLEEASGGITVCPLPAGDCRAGIRVELPCCLCMEATTVQSPLHVATLPLVEADLVFRFLSCFVCKGRRIDGRGHVAVGNGPPKRAVSVSYVSELLVWSG